MKTIEDSYYGTAEHVRSMARKMLYREPEVGSSNVRFVQPVRKRVLCKCGEKAAYPVIVRHGLRVCLNCAQTMQRKTGGRPAAVVYCKCGEKAAYPAVYRNGLRVCKSCARATYKK